MSLQILLHDGPPSQRPEDDANVLSPQTVFRPGDKVQGTVVLTSKKSEDISQVFVEFTGRCKVKIRRHDHYTTISHRTRGYYFRMRECVYDGGSYTFQSGTRTWPFSFQIPLEAESEDPRNERPTSKRELTRIGMMRRNELDGPEYDHFSSSRTWRGSYDNFRGRPDPHRLPETFDYLSNRFPASCEARVEYELTATLQRPTRGVLFPSKDLEASYDVPLRSQNFLQDFYHKAPRGKDPLHSLEITELKQNLGASHPAASDANSKSPSSSLWTNMFKQYEPPEVNVTFSLATSRYIRPGAVCILLLQTKEIILPAEKPKQASLPPIKLKAYTLRLIARTALRGKLESVMVQDINHYAVDGGRTLLTGKDLDLTVPIQVPGVGADDIQASLTSSPLENQGSSQKNNQASSSSSSPSSAAGWLTLSAPIPTAASMNGDRQPLTPSFKTYNISREYEFAITLQLECGGVKYDLKSSESVPVVVLAEEDHIEPKRMPASNGPGGPASRMGTAERSGAAVVRSTDSKVAPPPLDPPSIDEKSGPIPPPPPPLREEEEPLPKYEPGDVPGYHAGDTTAPAAVAAVVGGGEDEGGEDRQVRNGG